MREHYKGEAEKNYVPATKKGAIGCAAMLSAALSMASFLVFRSREGEGGATYRRARGIFCLATTFFWMGWDCVGGVDWGGWG